MGKKKSVVFMEGLRGGNPVFVQTLGICSALAVTTKLENAVVMSLGLTAITAISNVLVSILRDVIPHRIRLIVEMIIIASLVIVFDQVLQAYFYEVSKALSVYVGLIITNCIILGRAEAFALQNGPVDSFVDGIGNGLGYGVILCAVGAAREILGFGEIWGFRIMPSGFEPVQVMVLAPGAFIMLGILFWVFRYIEPVKE